MRYNLQTNLMKIAGWKNWLITSMKINLVLLVVIKTVVTSVARTVITCSIITPNKLMSPIKGKEVHTLTTKNKWSIPHSPKLPSYKIKNIQSAGLEIMIINGSLETLQVALKSINYNEIRLSQLRKSRLLI